MADDLGWVDIATKSTNQNNGSNYHETPNLDRMAAEGMSFTRVYSAPNCAPTRAMMLSGQYMTRTKVYNVGNLNRGTGTLLGPAQNEDVAAESTTIAETLQAAGYTTAHFGKYHVGGHEGGDSTLPLNQGFDFNFGGGSAGNPGSYFPNGNGVYSSKIGPELDAYAQAYDSVFRNGYRTYSTDGTNSLSYVLPSSLDGRSKHLGDAMSQAAVEFLKAHKDDVDPFYIQFHPYLVHTPNGTRNDLKSKYDGIASGDPRHTNSTYAAMVEQLDQQVGRILDTITDPNSDGDQSDSVADSTIVIFTTDNGGDSRTSNNPLKGNKGQFTEGGTRVPLIAWQPGTITASQISDELVNSVDFYPTLAEFADADLPESASYPLDGTSFKQIATGESSVRNKEAIFWHFPGYLDTRAKPTSIVTMDIEVSEQTKQFKLLYDYESKTYTLYNLTDDIGETNDLLDSASELAANRDTAELLSFELRSWLNDTGATYPLSKSGANAGQEVPAPLPFVELLGDLDDDAALTIKDWFALKPNFGVDVTALSPRSGYLLGDLNVDGTIDRFDFSVFKDQYDTVHGIDAFRDTLLAVPESNSLTLCLLGAIVLAGLQGRVRCVCQSSEPTFSSSSLSTLFASAKHISIAIAASITTASISAQGAAISWQGGSGTWIDSNWRVDDVIDQSITSGDSNSEDYVGDMFDFHPATGTIISDQRITLDGSIWKQSAGTLQVSSFGNFSAFNIGHADGASDVILAGTAAWDLAGSGNAGRTLQGREGRLMLSDSASLRILPGNNSPELEILNGFTLTMNDASTLEAEYIQYGSSGTTTAFFNLNGGTVTLNDSNPVRSASLGDGVGNRINFTGEVGSAEVVHTDISDPTKNLAAKFNTGFFAINGTVVTDSSTIVNGKGLQLIDDGLTQTLTLFEQPPVLPDPILTLKVSLVSGAVTIVNGTDKDVDLDYYELTSESGSLLPASWNSLQDQDFEGSGPPGDGNGWEQLGVAAMNYVAEGFLLGSTVLPSDTSVELGELYNTSSENDLSLAFRTTDGKFYDGQIIYLAPGDFDEDADVDLGDLGRWTNGFSSLSGAAVSDGDSDNDADVDGTDYLQWQRNLGLSMLQPLRAVATVPEPNTLIAIAVLVCISLSLDVSLTRWGGTR